MKFRPCIDLHCGRVKQIVGGTLRDEGNAAAENFVSDLSAAHYAAMYARDGLAGGHVIMLGPGNAEAARAALAARVPPAPTTRARARAGPAAGTAGTPAGSRSAAGSRRRTRPSGSPRAPRM